MQPPQRSSPGPGESGKLREQCAGRPKGKGSRETGSYRADSGFYSDCGRRLWRVLSRRDRVCLMFSQDFSGDCVESCKKGRG